MKIEPAVERGRAHLRRRGLPHLRGRCAPPLSVLAGEAGAGKETW